MNHKKITKIDITDCSVRSSSTCPCMYFYKKDGYLYVNIYDTNKELFVFKISDERFIVVNKNVKKRNFQNGLYNDAAWQNITE